MSRTFYGNWTSKIACGCPIIPVPPPNFLRVSRLKFLRSISVTAIALACLDSMAFHQINVPGVPRIVSVNPEDRNCSGLSASILYSEVWTREREKERREKREKRERERKERGERDREEKEERERREDREEKEREEREERQREREEREKRERR